MKNNNTVTSGYTKRAVIRREGYPVGQPAPMFIRCGCGAEVDVNYCSDETYRCTCGVEYDSRGWIITGQARKQVEQSAPLSLYGFRGGRQ